RAMPVRTCSTNARRVALPKTYHHPVRGGTGCSSARRAAVRRPLRSSSQSKNSLITPASHDRDRTRQDLDLPVPNTYGVLRKRLGRRTGSDGTVGVIDAAVTRTEEELGVAEPPYRTPQVSAVDRKRGEPAGILSPKPRR